MSKLEENIQWEAVVKRLRENRCGNRRENMCEIMREIAVKRL